MVIKSIKHQKGFTLIEVLTASVILIFIAFGIMTLAIYFFKNYSFSFTETQLIGQTQTTITSLVREIREAKTAEDGAWPIAEANDNSFTFYADINNDDHVEKVRYYLENNELKKSVIAPTAIPISYPISNEKIYIIVSNVDNNSNPLFRYFNGNWPGDTINNPLPIAARILSTKLVKIYLRINIPTQTVAQPYEMTADVQIRNLKDNL